MRLGVAACLMLACSGPAVWAQTTSSVPGQGSAPAVAAPAAEEQKICKREVPLGSNLPKRVCRTAAEWKIIARSNEEQARRALDRRRGGMGVDR